MQHNQHQAGRSDEELSFSLPVENEILVLKLKAEFGAECSAIDRDIPPAVINEFLKFVYAFERDVFRHAPLVSIYQKIGKPFFPKAAVLPDEALEKTLKTVKRLLARHRIQLNVPDGYPPRDIYAFITEELFRFEIEDIDLPHYTYHFYYEDFHPNHEQDIHDKSVAFLNGWARQMIDPSVPGFADSFIHPDARTFSKENILKKAQYVFESYRSFENCCYDIKNIVTDIDDRNGSGIGYAEGMVGYDAVTASGGSMHFEGPCMFYFSNNGEGWRLFYFVFPGFSWDE